MPAIPTCREPLQRRRGRAAPAAERDIPEILIAYQDDPELHLQAGPGAAPERRRAGAAGGARPRTERAAGTRLTLTIVEPGADVCRGQVYVHDVDWDNAGPSSRSGWRRRSAAAAWPARRWASPPPGCSPPRRSRGSRSLADPDNEPMIRAARAAGFVEEGVLRGYYREGGGRVDATVLSLLPRD